MEIKSDDGQANTTGANAASEIEIANDTSNSEAPTFSSSGGSIRLFQPGDSGLDTSFLFDTTTSEGSNSIFTTGSGRYITTGAIDGVRFTLLSSNAFSSGKFSLYGIRT